VTTTADALALLGLPDDKRILDLSAEEMSAFRKLIGWEPGAPVISYPTRDESASRADREEWKANRAGKGKTEPCLWLETGQVDCFRKNLESDSDTQDWWAGFIESAEAVANLPLPTIASLVPDQGPWTFAGSYCPNCIGQKSPTTQHAGFWNWTVLDPDKLNCPYCGITYPHPDYPEDGSLALPRLGQNYPFHISSGEHASDDWRDGKNASNFADIPTHVSFTGEIRTAKLAWCLGQVEPLSVAYAVTGETRFAEIVRTVLSRLADVYGNYPVFSYGQEYIDADPAYATDNIDALPTAFRRAASLATYTGSYGGRTGNRGMDQTTPTTSHYANAEWGSSRLGREKASNGQLFLTVFKGYDLIKQTIAAEERRRIEHDFLLELYLDTRGLSQRVNNKSGPGMASRVAVGVFYDDEDALQEGLSQFHEIMEGQFYEDGSWKETPIYGAKSMFEGLSEIPEMLRGRIDFYADPLYRKALETYAESATPLDTQPAIGDSTAEYRLQPFLVDIARIRMGMPMSYGPESLAGFGVRSPLEVGNNSGYVPSLNCLVTDDDRTSLDGPIGFGSVGHIPRKPTVPCWVSMFNEPRPVAPAPPRPALNRYYEGRKLACLGFGEGEQAVQLYCDGGDGRTQHRHQAPLSLLLFAGGREVFPDQGYIGDHPANAWIKTTASHNTVIVDCHLAHPADRTDLRAFEADDELCFLDIETEMPGPSGRVILRRATTMITRPDGFPVLLDVFDVSGGSIHDYIVRVNDPTDHFELGLALTGQASPYPGLANPGPTDFRSAGPSEGRFAAKWGGSESVWAHILTPADEVITFRSPAWRNRMEVFEEPDRSWNAIILRSIAAQSRFVVVYDVGGKQPWIEHVEISQTDPELTVRLETAEGDSVITLSDGKCRVIKLRS
jgi:hypothetical protein